MIALAAALAALACPLPAHPAPGGRPLVWGIGPLSSGDSGNAQAPVVVENTAKRDAALRALAGRRRPFVLRLNRLFESDGAAGIARYRELAHHFTQLGFQVELQVRYHPAAAANGDLAQWLAFVRGVVRAFGPDRGVSSLQIANEVNIGFSPNTSDGAFLRSRDALVEGVVAAKRAARRYPQLKIGFNWADLGLPNDESFWASLADPRLRRAVDWVGIDTYPGTFPPHPLTDPRTALLGSLARLRGCLMPLAGLGARVPIRVEETGWPTDHAARSESQQLTVLRGLAGAASDFRRSLNVSDFRWFNLRDNNTAAAGLQAHFGLLHDDYTPKPAFAAYRAIVRGRRR